MRKDEPSYASYGVESKGKRMQSLMPVGSNGAQVSRSPQAVGKVWETAGDNRVLASLPQHELRHLVKSAECVRLKPRQIIQERNLPLRHAYFMGSSIASLQMWRGQGLTIETRTVGSNDLVGLAILLGTWRSPRRCVVQVGGDALRIPAGELAAFAAEYPAVRSVFLAYVHAAIGHSSQLLSCNTSHSVKDRVVRWLLTASYQLRSTDIPVTHSSIARCLAVRRASVTNVVGQLEGENRVRQERGLISVINAEELERGCCGCHRAIRELYERLPRVVQGNAAPTSAFADSRIAA